MNAMSLRPRMRQWSLDEIPMNQYDLEAGVDHQADERTRRPLDRAADRLLRRKTREITSGSVGSPMVVFPAAAGISDGSSLVEMESSVFPGDTNLYASVRHVFGLSELLPRGTARRTRGGS